MRPGGFPATADGPVCPAHRPTGQGAERPTCYPHHRPRCPGAEPLPAPPAKVPSHPPPCTSAPLRGSARLGPPATGQSAATSMV